MKTSARPQPPFRRIVIVGVGVIGGSLGLAIRSRYRGVRVVGVDRSEVLRRAMRKGALDESETRVARAMRGADLVFLATPVSVIQTLLPMVARHADPGTLITDVGSVKRGIVRQASGLFPAGNFIGGHPMAGVELSGVEAAHPLLFENAVYVLTPTKANPPRLVRKLAEFLEELGSRVMLLDAVTHDSVASVVSHLPQLTAVAITNVAGRVHRDGRQHLRLAAGGFRDLTRIASSRPEIWKDILALNRDEIRRSLSLLIRELSRYRKALGSGGGEISASFRSARRIRDRIPKSMKGFIRPLAEVFVFVRDEPGMMAKMTSVLARARLNIKDIELVKVREGRGGTFRLAFDTRDVAGQATHVLRRAGFEVGE